MTSSSKPSQIPTRVVGRNSQLPGTRINEEACLSFNSELMRTLMARKMLKNKTFYESKVMMHAGGVQGFLQAQQMVMNN